MFGKKHKSSGGGLFGPLFGLFRIILSLAILGVLILGMYQAYKSFSGVDPLKTDPKAIIENILASEDAYALITGLLTTSPDQSIDKAKQIIENDFQTQIAGPSGEQRINQNIPIKLKFAIVSDSHRDNQNLLKALEMAKQAGAEFVIGLGDFSDVGTTEELSQAKKQFDSINLPYYTTAGDHDLWDSRNRNLPVVQNFTDIFGSPYASFANKGVRFIILYNSDNYFGVEDVQLQWLEDELSKEAENENLKFVMTAIPLYHPSSDHIMGKENEKLKLQADHLIEIFKEAGISEVFAGDTHFYSRYTEPNSELKMTSVGAVTSDRNAQAPRFVMVEIFEDGGYNIQDLEIQ